MSGIGRRSFFKRMAGAAAAAVALGIDDPERLLWEPGKKTIFLPTSDVIRPRNVAIEDINKRFKLEVSETKIHSGAEVNDAIREHELKQQGRFVAGPSRYTVTVMKGGHEFSEHFDEHWRPVAARTREEAKQRYDRTFRDPHLALRAVDTVRHPAIKAAKDLWDV